jgi:acyl-CoA synthetase (AMP-forming)/AMP-acid ligase II
VNLATVLEMAASGYDDRVAIADGKRPVSYTRLLDRVRHRAGALRAEADRSGAGHVVYIGLSGETFLEHLLACAWAGLVFVPLNYRTKGPELAPLPAPFRPVLIVHDERYEATASACAGESDRLLRSDAEPGAARLDAYPLDGEALAIVLHTSGTTSKPKAVLLRHRHLSSYIFSTVEFASSPPGETALVCVPPYHIAGIMGVLTPLFAGRRMAFLPQFDPREWLRVATEHAVTHAFVVPTMLGRILDVMEREPALVPPHLRHIAYGGGPMHLAVIERALILLPEVDFVNAYGLTETSSTVAVLGPEDHRQAMSSRDPAVRARLGSVGRALPSIDVRIVGEDGDELPAGEVGVITIAGPQVSAHYHGVEAPPERFATGDLGYLDGEGYLFIAGRSDDVIIRGGENISPGEIEDVLARHPAVAGVAVVGVPDQEWGQRVVAFVESRGSERPSDEELVDFARGSLAGFKVPGAFVFVGELPRTDTGKVLRTRLRQEWVDASASVARAG